MLPFLPLLNEQLNWNGPAIYRVNGLSNGHRVELTFTQANFRPRGRRLSWQVIPGSEGGGSRTVLPSYWDGRRWKSFLGDDSRPVEFTAGISTLSWLTSMTELVDLRVRVDGHNWPVPKRQLVGVLNPNFGDLYVRCHVDNRGKSIQIWLKGADGAAGYEVCWTVPRSGLTTRRSRFLD